MPGVSFELNLTPVDESLQWPGRFPAGDGGAVPRRTAGFDYLRCQSGVDYLSELESVYHLYSFTHGHSLAVKVRCPAEDTHIPTVCDLWAAANWHERETHEMFGIVFDGHPDLRPLLLEEGLGYYPLLKSHPLADIEEWQEDYLQAIEDAKKQMAAAGGTEPVVDEKAMKIQIAQQKAQIIKKTRDEARAKGLSDAEQKAAVTAALEKFEAEQASQPQGGGAPPAMSKIEMAQAKAKVITKARSEARAQGWPPKTRRSTWRRSSRSSRRRWKAPPRPRPPPPPSRRCPGSSWRRRRRR